MEALVYTFLLIGNLAIIILLWVWVTTKKTGAADDFPTCDPPKADCPPPDCDSELGDDYWEESERYWAEVDANCSDSDADGSDSEGI